MRYSASNSDGAEAGPSPPGYGPQAGQQAPGRPDRASSIQRPGRPDGHDERRRRNRPLHDIRRQRTRQRPGFPRRARRPIAAEAADTVIDRSPRAPRMRTPVLNGTPEDSAGLCSTVSPANAVPRLGNCPFHASAAPVGAVSHGQPGLKAEASAARFQQHRKPLTCRYAIEARELPKLRARVRFSSPAPRQRPRSATRALFIV